MKADYYLGIDIGGTKCAVVAGTSGMEVLERIQFATETQKGPDFAIGKLLEISSNLIHKFSDHHLISIGISCGGPLNSKTGVIQSPPNLPGWDNIDIVRIFKEKYAMPVFLQNDANACALAEWRFGAGKGTRNMVFLTFGTGLGAGLILDGRLYAGTNDLAGEIGHINPECIVIGSIYARNPYLFESACKKMIEIEALRPAHEVCRIVPAALGDEVGDYASLSVAMEFVKGEEYFH